MNKDKECMEQLHYWPNGRKGFCWCGDAYR